MQKQLIQNVFKHTQSQNWTWEWDRQWGTTREGRCSWHWDLLSVTHKKSCREIVVFLHLEFQKHSHGMCQANACDGLRTLKPELSRWVDGPERWPQLSFFGYVVGMVQGWCFPWRMRFYTLYSVCDLFEMFFFVLSRFLLADTFYL